jgi:ribosome biogenesis protein MAK21
MSPSKKASDAERHNAHDEKSLLEDVRKYAAELGFPSAGGGGSMGSFDDFAPGKAKKKLSSSHKKGSDKKDGKNSNKGEEKNVDINLKPKQKTRPVAKKTEEFPFPLPDIPKDASKLKTLFSFKDEGLWFEMVSDVPQKSVQSSAKNDDTVVAQMRERASKLLEIESIVAAKDASLSKNSNISWLQQAKQGGTTSDKVAAMAVLVQEFPVAHLKSLEGLVTMSGKRGGARAVVGTTLDILIELWKDVLLPPNRKLRYFYQQPLSEVHSSSKSSDRWLVMWEFEDRLKTQYATFVEQLAVLSTDNLDFIKEKATKTAFELLLHRSEQEGELLKIVVNKLGDPDRKLASNAGYLLTKLLAHHHGMKHVVVREIENFIYRPGLKDRARYYAVIYLNQIVLSSKDPPKVLPNGTSVTLAKRLVDIYFTLFKLIIEGSLGTAASIAQAKEEKLDKIRKEKAIKKGKKKLVKDSEPKTVGGDRQGVMDSRMLSALITGIRRAFPYVGTDEIEPLIEAHADSLFKLIHTASFGVATQALLLLYQLMSSQSSISDRFYRALYSCLFNKELPISTKAPLFLSLFLKAVKGDVSTTRTVALVKRLMQVALEAPANFACGCLIVLSEILKESPALWNTINDAEEEREDDNQDDARGLYDPSKRDPQHAQAQASCLWELIPLSKHAHPSVAAMSKSILAGVPVHYNGDPLKDFVLSEFLGKFISKKSKKKTDAGDSLMQPISQKFSILESLDNKSIAPDEAFFHKFFQIKDDRKQVSKRKAKSQDADDSDEDSSLAEDDFLAGEEGDDGAFGDMDHGYDYDQLAEAMQDPGDASSDDTSMSSLEGEEFPSLSGEQESGEDYSSVEDIVESDMDEEDAKDKEEVFASLDDYSEMIAKDFEQS